LFGLTYQHPNLHVIKNRLTTLLLEYTLALQQSADLIQDFSAVQLLFGNR